MNKKYIYFILLFVLSSCSSLGTTNKTLENDSEIELISEYDKVIQKSVYNLLKSEISNNFQHKYELYSIGDRCGCHAYPCRLDIIDNVENKLLYTLNSEHIGPCHILPTDGIPFGWYDNNNIVVKFEFGDSGSYGYHYQLYHVTDKEISKELFRYSRNSFYSYPLHFVYFENNKYLFDTNNGSKLDIYEVPIDSGLDIYSINGESLIYDKLSKIDEMNIEGDFKIIDKYEGIYFEMGEHKYQFIKGKIINYIQ